MKFLTTFTFSILMFGAVFSQDIDTRLLEVYSESELVEMINSDKDQYQLLVNSIGNALQIVDSPKGKESKVTNEIVLPEGDYTFLDLDLKIMESNQYFKIRGTDKMLIVKSYFVLGNELKH